MIQPGELLFLTQRQKIAAKEQSGSLQERLCGDTHGRGCCWRAWKMPESLFTEHPCPAAPWSPRWVSSHVWCSLMEHLESSFSAAAAKPSPCSLFCWLGKLHKLPWDRKATFSGC